MNFGVRSISNYIFWVGSGNILHTVVKSDVVTRKGMPVLTRAAALELGQAEGANSASLGLRGSVTNKADAVWVRRAQTDAYTSRSRADTPDPQVDHIVEVQLLETAFARAFVAHRASAGSMATRQATQILRDCLNSTGNLNVTSRDVNATKRGPFTAALNRMRDGRLRDIDVHELARRGRARRLVDDGAWGRICSSVVRSYDDLHDELCGSGVAAIPAAATLVQASVDSLGDMLNTIGLK